jgi:hypothetical protein
MAVIKQNLYLILIKSDLIGWWIVITIIVKYQALIVDCNDENQ